MAKNILTTCLLYFRAAHLPPPLRPLWPTASASPGASRGCAGSRPRRGRRPAIRAAGAPGAAPQRREGPPPPAAPALLLPGLLQKAENQQLLGWLKVNLSVPTEDITKTNARDLTTSRLPSSPQPVPGGFQQPRFSVPLGATPLQLLAAPARGVGRQRPEGQRRGAGLRGARGPQALEPVRVSRSGGGGGENCKSRWPVDGCLLWSLCSPQT